MKMIIRQQAKTIGLCLLMFLALFYLFKHYTHINQTKKKYIVFSITGNGWANRLGGMHSSRPFVFKDLNATICENIVSNSEKI